MDAKRLMCALFGHKRPHRIPDAGAGGFYQAHQLCSRCQRWIRREPDTNPAMTARTEEQGE